MDTPIYDITFLNDFPSFQKLNAFMEEKLVGKSKKKSMMLGTIQVALAIIYLILMFVTKQPLGTFTVILAVIILFLGLFSLSYYPVFFRRKVDKVVKQTFETSEYLKSPVQFQFFEDTCFEISVVEKREFPYALLDEIVEDDNNFYVMSNRIGICFPKKAFEGRDREFYEFMKERIENK